MYSVIQFGGFQHKVTVGETVKLAKFAADVGSDLKISEILLVANGDKIEVGAPHVPNSTVTCEVLAHGKDDKLKIFKKKRRKGYRLTAGHRQQYTEVLVKEIASDSGKDSVNKKYIERARARVTALIKQKQDLPKKSTLAPESKAEVIPEVKTESKTKIEAKPKSEGKSKTESKVKAEIKPKAKAKTEDQAKTDVKSKPKAKAKPAAPEKPKE